MESVSSRRSARMNVSWGAQLALRHLTFADRSCRRYDSASHSWPSLRPTFCGKFPNGGNFHSRLVPSSEPAPQTRVCRWWRPQLAGSRTHDKATTFSKPTLGKTTEPLGAAVVESLCRPGRPSALIQASHYRARVQPDETARVEVAGTRHLNSVNLSAVRVSGLV